MIKKVHIKNFQSHKDTTLDFHPGVNVIVGSTDNGKSAIIRALRFVVYNRPLGNRIRSWWGGDTSVTVELEDGVEISRVKASSDYYTMSTLEKPFKAIGTNVPAEVTNELNLTEVNLQLQLDSVFLLSKTPGEVAAYFNKVAGLSKIDTATSNVNSWIATLNADIKKNEKDIEKNKALEEGFVYLQKFESSIEVLEDLEKKLKAKSAQRRGLDVLLGIHEQGVCNLKSLKKVVKLEPFINSVTSKIAARKEKQEEVKKLYQLIHKIKTYTSAVKEHKKMTALETKVNKMLRLYEVYNAKNQQRIQLNKQLNLISNTKQQLTNAKAEFRRLSIAYEEAFPDICPLCGSPKKHTHQ